MKHEKLSAFLKSEMPFEYPRQGKRGAIVKYSMMLCVASIMIAALVALVVIGRDGIGAKASEPVNNVINACLYIAWISSLVSVFAMRKRS